MKALPSFIIIIELQTKCMDAVQEFWEYLMCCQNLKQRLLVDAEVIPRKLLPENAIYRLSRNSRVQI